MSARLRLAALGALPFLRQYIDEAGPCDHAVNICVCGIVRAADSLSDAIAEPDGWVSVESILPDVERGGGVNDSADVLVIDRRGEVNVAYYRVFDDYGGRAGFEPRWVQRGRDGYHLENITHWRAIP